MIIKSKSLSSEELSKIEDEWSDSKVVCELLSHISYLTDTIISLVGENESEGDSNGD